MKSTDLHSVIVNNSSWKKIMLLGENEDDYFSNSSSSSGSEDRNAEKLTSKEFKTVKNNDSKDSTSDLPAMNNTSLYVKFSSWFLLLLLSKR